MRRLLSSAVTVSLSLSFAASALAIDTTATDPCAGKQGRERGKCVSDVIKSWSKLNRNFREKLEAERAAWKKEHVGMGETDEYRKALSEFLAKQEAERKAFKEMQLSLQREFLNVEKEFRQTRPGKASGYVRRVTKNEVSSAEEACKAKTDSRDKRICLREALKLRDPAVKSWWQR